MIAAIILLLVVVLLCSAGAYFVANTICQLKWKEKVAQSKLLGFAAIYTMVFVILACLIAVASNFVFGR
jgi:tryptophan-rich sensory protein